VFNALAGSTRLTSRARIITAVAVIAVLIAAALQITTNANAGALTITKYAGVRDAGAIDYNHDGVGDDGRYGGLRNNLSVGEMPSDGSDLRVFFPFWVTDEMVAAAKDGGTATASFKVSKVANLDNRKLVLDGYPDTTVANKVDYAASATRLATLDPVVGKISVDVTPLIRNLTGDQQLILRLKLDGIASKDGELARVNVAMSEASSTANRPVLTVVGPTPTEPASIPSTSTTTTPPVTTPPTTTPAPPAETPGPVSASSVTAGTVVGSAQYPVPASAIIVSPTGNDAAAGTVAAPLLTLTKAVSKAAAGSTIVLRGGTYHESVAFYKQLTIQAWPGEAVWLDGSVPVTSWAASGGKWHHDGWTTKFDASPTYTRGAADSTAAYWGFVSPNYPMASHPDQIWVDGVAQRQVGSLAEVVGGTFFYDEAAQQLWLGSDPTGAEVRASDLVRALMIRAEGSIVRGIGIRRFAPSVPDMGAVTVERNKVLVENVAITDTATTGLCVASAADVVLRNLYLARNGLLGACSSVSDNLTLDRVLSENNNTEHFNRAPVSGGFKITRSRGLVVKDSVFAKNDGPGLWFDESVYDMTITGNEMRDNAGHGISIEISAKALFADNIVTNNGGFGIKINNTSDVSVWNNTFVGNDRSINIVQDTRLPTSATSVGRDKRQPFPDPTMTWLNGPVKVANNVIANQRTGNCMLCVEDYSKKRTADQIGVTANGNVYNRPAAASPSWLVVWSTGAGNPAVYTSLAAFRTGTGQESGGLSLDGASLLDTVGSLLAAPTNTPLGLPAAVATATGHPTGTAFTGAWPRT
jgi:trimeric autotransporter adhesin